MAPEPSRPSAASRPPTPTPKPTPAPLRLERLSSLRSPPLRSPISELRFRRCSARKKIFGDTEKLLFGYVDHAKPPEQRKCQSNDDFLGVLAISGTRVVI